MQEFTEGEKNLTKEQESQTKQSTHKGEEKVLRDGIKK